MAEKDPFYCRNAIQLKDSPMIGKMLNSWATTAQAFLVEFDDIFVNKHFF